MNLPPPVRHPQHQPEQPADLDLPPPMSLGKEKKLAAIGLVASVVFLLIAGGVATWIFMQKSGSDTVVTKVDPNSTNNVTNLSWVAPEIPAGYEKFDQTMSDIKAVYYANASEGCSLTTRVLPTPQTDDMAKYVAQLNDSVGIQTGALAGEGGVNVSIKDVNGKQEYDFKGAEFDQTVNVPTLDYKAQTGVFYYREFGNNLATISYTCKLATYKVDGELLGNLVKNFTIKTER